MITFYLNGRKESVSVDPAMPLLWLLRDVLQLTGTKYGCGKGLCGACTVLMDGVPVRSCITPTALAQGKHIVTVEGLSEKHADLLKNWEQLNVPQCGFCQPGQLVSAAALLESNPNPSDADIDAAMEGNICRCGTYSRIKTAIKKTITERNHENR